MWPGLNPDSSGGVVPISAHPAFHADDGEVRSDSALRIEHACQFSYGHAVANGRLTIADEGLASGIGHRPLHIGAADGVWTVKHDHHLICRCGRFKKIAEGALVGVKAHAHILDVVDDQDRKST